MCYPLLAFPTIVKFCISSLGSVICLCEIPSFIYNTGRHWSLFNGNSFLYTSGITTASGHCYLIGSRIPDGAWKFLSVLCDGQGVIIFGLQFVLAKLYYHVMVLGIVCECFVLMDVCTSRNGYRGILNRQRLTIVIILTWDIQFSFRIGFLGSTIIWIPNIVVGVIKFLPIVSRIRFLSASQKQLVLAVFITYCACNAVAITGNHIHQIILPTQSDNVPRHILMCKWSRIRMSRILHRTFHRITLNPACIQITEILKCSGIAFVACRCAWIFVKDID